MPNVLMIAVALWAGLFMVAAVMTVSQWRRGGGQPSTPDRDRRGAVAGLAEAGRAGRQAVAAPVRKMVRQIRRPEGPATSECAEVTAWPEHTRAPSRPGPAKVSATPGQKKITARTVQTTIPARARQSVVPARSGQPAVPVRPVHWAIPVKPEHADVSAAAAPAKMPAGPGQTAQSQVSVVCDAQPGQHRPAAEPHREPEKAADHEPDQQQADAEIVAISERIARFYAEADRPVADWLRTLGWIGEDAQNSRLP